MQRATAVIQLGKWDNMRNATQYSGTNMLVLLGDGRPLLALISVYSAFTTERAIYQLTRTGST